MYSLNERNGRSVTISKFYQQQISVFLWSISMVILWAQAGSTKHIQNHTSLEKINQIETEF